MAGKHTSGVHFLDAAHYDTGNVCPLVFCALLKLGAKQSCVLFSEGIKYRLKDEGSYLDHLRG